MFARIKFPLAFAALDYWGGEPHLCAAREGDAWIAADCEDEARSAAVEDGGLGMPSAFGDDGIDSRASTQEAA